MERLIPAEVYWNICMVLKPAISFPVVSGLARVCSSQPLSSLTISTKWYVDGTREVWFFFGDLGL